MVLQLASNTYVDVVSDINCGMAMQLASYLCSCDTLKLMMVCSFCSYRIYKNGGNVDCQKRFRVCFHCLHLYWIIHKGKFTTLVWSICVFWTRSSIYDPDQINCIIHLLHIHWPIKSNANECEKDLEVWIKYSANINWPNNYDPNQLLCIRFVNIYSSHLGFYAKKYIYRNQTEMKEMTQEELRESSMELVVW